MHAADFQDGADDTTGDETGTGTSWFNQNARAGDFGFGFVRQVPL